MPYYVNQVLMQWRDQNQETCTNFMVTLDQAEGGSAGYTALADALQNCSDALLTAIQFQQTLIRVGDPGPGDYATVWDRASILANVETTRQPTRVEIPAPKSTIFMPTNNRVVNLASPLIVALQAECSAFLGDAHGNAMGMFKRGVRTNARGA